MSDIYTSVSTAISIAKRLKEISDNVKDAEFKNLLADLSLELAEVKMTLAGVIEENARLKQEIGQLSCTDTEPCPRCRKRSWGVIDSRPDPTFGIVGGIKRTYECSVCGFKEDKLIA